MYVCVQVGGGLNVCMSGGQRREYMCVQVLLSTGTRVLMHVEYLYVKGWRREYMCVQVQVSTGTHAHVCSCM